MTLTFPYSTSFVSWFCSSEISTLPSKQLIIPSHAACLVGCSSEWGYLFDFIFLFVSSTTFPLHALTYRKRSDREQKLWSVTHLWCLSSPYRNNVVCFIHRKCHREVKAHICENTCSMACYLFQLYWGHISHTTGRILSKVGKLILFNNPALTLQVIPYPVQLNTA